MILPHLCMKLTVKLKYPIFKMAAGKIMGLEFTLHLHKNIWKTDFL